MPKRKIINGDLGVSSRRGAFFNPKVKPVKFQSLAGLRTPVKRNQLCPCGSGKKYKVCCRTIGRTMKPVKEEP